MDQGDKMLFEQRLAVGEGEGEVLAWGKSISGRGTSTEPWDERGLAWPRTQMKWLTRR